MTEYCCFCVLWNEVPLYSTIVYDHKQNQKLLKQCNWHCIIT